MTTSIPTLRATGLGLLLLAADFGQADEAPAVTAFDIPAQPLSSALLQLSEASGMKILFREDLVRGRTAPVLKGSYSAEQGLHKLLSGSGLSYRHTAADAVTLERSATPAAAPNSDIGATALPRVTVKGKAVDDSDDPYNPSYTRPNTTTATKTDTPIMETPVSVQVVPRAVMDDQQVVRLEDALRNVSSVQSGTTLGIFQDDLTVRGFPLGVDIDSAVYRNGSRLTSVKAVTHGLERIEVLKGPAAVLYGRIEPGALVNLVTKKPQDAPYYSLKQEFGSYDMFRTSADATGPVTQDGSVLYRMVFDYLTRDTFRDFQFEDQVYVSPSVTWRLSEDTRLDMNYEFRTADIGADEVGIPAIGDRPARIPLRRNLGDPFFEREHREDHILDASLSHRINQDWSIRLKGTYANEDRSADASYKSAEVGQDGYLPRGFLGARLDHDTWYTSLDITGHFDLWLTRHTVLVGADYYREVRDSRLVFGTIPAINIFNPSYGGIPRPDFNTATPFEMINQWHGVYMQDQIALHDQLHLLLGARYDDALSVRGLKGFNAETKNDAWSPRYGLLYRPWSWLSLYGSYVESIGAANPGLRADGTVFDPESAEQWETGVKTELFDKRFNATLAYYDLTKQNIKVPRPGGFFEAIGEARSRGVELDLSGQLTEKLGLIGSYAYTDSEILQGISEEQQGNRLMNVPRHAGSLWARYELTEAFTIGAGVYAAGQREMDNANTAQVPGYVRLDAMAAYRWKVGDSRLTTQLNVYNLLDKDYFQAVNQFDNRTAFPGAPLTFIGSVRMEY